MMSKPTSAPHNVDAGEIDKFSQLAHKWWDETSEFKPLHDINPLRLGYIDQYGRIGGKTVLDVGCGGGRSQWAAAYQLFYRQYGSEK